MREQIHHSNIGLIIGFIILTFVEQLKASMEQLQASTSTRGRRVGLRACASAGLTSQETVQLGGGTSSDTVQLAETEHDPNPDHKVEHTTPHPRPNTLE